MKTKIIIPIFILLVAFLSCSKDNGVEPESIKSAIKGEITLTGEWPVTPEDVRIVAAKKFPLTSIDDLDFGESIPDGVDTYSYTYYLKHGEYQMVGVAWREQGGSWALTSVCGLYFVDGDSLNPGGVIIPTETSIVEGIDMAVDRSKARRTSTSEVTGTATFYGAWPDSFTSAIVMASIKDPLSESFSILDLSYSAPITSGTETFEYAVGVAPGLYKSQGVIFLKENEPITLDDIYYTQNIGGLVIQDLDIGNGEIVEGPDFDLQLSPITSAITGTIQFSGEWPETAEEIRIVASTAFPPSLEEMIVGEELPADVELYNYRFDLRPDTYKIVGVVWRAAGTQFDLLSVCGVYFAGTDTLAPSEVVIPNDTSLIQDINIRVNRSKARVITDSRITGSITFDGDWPTDITDMRLIATTRFSLFPLELPSLFDLSFSETMPVGVESIDYVIKAFPATYVATGVIFFREGQTLSINDILYSAEVNGLAIEDYTVERDSTVIGPNFEIEF
ncbi:hypothetical protein HQ585_16550 [candidate division KSB1 bacterium]|nr:hypothetical protein [candidate division KSB1 bacterium]